MFCEVNLVYLQLDLFLHASGCAAPIDECMPPVIAECIDEDD